MIWRIYPTDTDLLFGEGRDTEEKKAGFFSLDRKTGELLWSGSKIDDWWVGVEGVRGDTVFLHGFATPDMPMHKGITALHGPTGDTLWAQPEACFEYGCPDGVVASHGAPGSRRYQLLDYANGSVVREWPENPAEPMPPPAEMSRTIRYPSFFRDLHSSPFAGHVKDETTGPVAGMARGSWVILTFRTKSSGGTGQELVVLDPASGAEVYRDRIHSGGMPFVPDSFLVQESFLYYVREHHDLVAVHLPEARP